MFERFIYSFKKLCKNYYDDIENNIHSLFFRKVYTTEKTNSKRINYIFDINDKYLFDNYCSFCLNPKKNDVFIELECGHQLHYYCFKQFLLAKHEHCPFCKEKINTNDVKRFIRDENEIKDSQNLFLNINEINELYYE